MTEAGIAAEAGDDHVAEVLTAAGAFGLGAVETEPVVATLGHQGRVWRVTTRQGDFALKELLVELTERDARAELLDADRAPFAGVGTASGPARDRAPAARRPRHLTDHSTPTDP